MLYDSLQVRSSSSNEEKSTEFGIVQVEYSSPVSVLDNRVHKEDSHSSLPYKGINSFLFVE